MQLNANRRISILFPTQVLPQSGSTGDVSAFIEGAPTRIPTSLGNGFRNSKPQWFKGVSLGDPGSENQGYKHEQIMHDGYISRQSE